MAHQPRASKLKRRTRSEPLQGDQVSPQKVKCTTTKKPVKIADEQITTPPIKQRPRHKQRLLNCAPGVNRRPKIIVGHDEHSVCDAAIQALASVEDIFQFGDKLVEVIGDDTGRSRIAHISQPRLRELLSKHATWWTKANGGRLVQRRVDIECVKQVAARGDWPLIRRLKGLIQTPVLRSDGTLLAKPGYDAATQLLYVPGLDLPCLAAHPTKDDAGSALRCIRDVVADFPFASLAHESAFLAALLTPFARFSYLDSTPMFMIDKNARGTGGTLLAQVIGNVYAGHDIAVTAAATDDVEWRKRLLSIGMAGESLVLIDNVTGQFGWPSLDGALTAGEVRDRLLGRSQYVTVPMRTIWIVTGNNIVVRADTARRCLHIRLESVEERPEERSKFKHSDLLSFVRESRSRLITASLTILRAYSAAGSPDMRLTPWGSFTGWSKLIRGALTWLGLPDPASTRREFAAQADCEFGDAARLIEAWRAKYGTRPMLLSNVLKECATLEDELSHDLNEAISEFIRGTPTTGSLGMRLYHLKRRRIEGFYFDCRDAKGHTKEWFLTQNDKTWGG